MADASAQRFSNHTRYDPLFHFFILPVFVITLVSCIVHAFRRPGLHSAWLVVFMIAALMAVFKVRVYSLKVQDRVIRLEERLRLVSLLEPGAASADWGAYGIAAGCFALRVGRRIACAGRASAQREAGRGGDQESDSEVAGGLLAGVKRVEAIKTPLSTRDFCGDHLLPLLGPACRNSPTECDTRGSEKQYCHEHKGNDGVLDATGIFQLTTDILRAEK